MNEAEIRDGFHRVRLTKYHSDPDARVVDELGLKHGRCRADIAVINSHLLGYEIKSDEDTMRRLDRQIGMYNAIFDYATVVVGVKHETEVFSLIPDWWGAIVCCQDCRTRISFQTIRAPRLNRGTDLFSIAQLLWRTEAMNILAEHGVQPSDLRQTREVLYGHLMDLLSPSDLRRQVRESLKKRPNWRCPAPPSPNGGLCLPVAK